MRKNVFLAVLLLSLSLPLVSDAQLRWGGRVGANFSSVPVKTDDFSSKNLTAMHGGIMVEYGVPFVPVFLEGGVLYSRTGANIFVKKEEKTHAITEDFIQIPMNVKLKLDVFPTIRAVLYAGPNFSLNTSNTFSKLKELDADKLERSRALLGFQAGLGIEFFRALQLSAEYSAPLGKAYKYTGVNQLAKDFYDKKHKVFSLSATYFF